jgi:hypothetical protein
MVRIVLSAAFLRAVRGEFLILKSVTNHVDEYSGFPKGGIWCTNSYIYPPVVWRLVCFFDFHLDAVMAPPP